MVGIRQGSLPANTSFGSSLPNVSSSEFANGAPQNDDIVVIASIAGMGHNNPPPEPPNPLRLLRMSILGAIQCILTCHGSSSYAAILYSDLVGDSALDRSVIGKFDTRRVSNRDFSKDWNYLSPNADKLIRNPNGTMTAHFGLFNVTRYVSSTGQGNTLFFRGPGMTTTKFRY